MSLLGESTSGTSQLESPQEVVGFLEVWAHSGDLVHEVLNGVDSMLAKGSIDESIICEGNSLVVDFTVPSLVDQFLYGFSGGITKISG